ncbi:hypothetical protein GCM10007147_21740 [Nocardiopsis kunsanensis]|uniref:Uncharacterized protein n=1 Tax=Nocardiopsis kunsanensis TaxID=141693 RepID=A0A918XBH7_9ACTN|nr:hypothetical protein GCM10007147_21740 [Nocardiopsis kunsanensis]
MHRLARYRRAVGGRADGAVTPPEYRVSNQAQAELGGSLIEEFTDVGAVALVGEVPDAVHESTIWRR